MLNELKNLEYQGGKDGLLFFICNVIGHRPITKKDASVICGHASGKHYWPIDDLVTYCSSFGWIDNDEEKLSISPEIVSCLENRDKLNRVLVISTVSQMFAAGIFYPDMFFYDVTQCCYAFRNELLPLSFSCVRNVLISQGFFTSQRNTTGTYFYISAVYESLIARYCKEQRRLLTLQALKKQLESNELAGERAEEFVLNFERKRISFPLCEKIRQISEIDVSAGYDIISFETSSSQEYDRFIEVKATTGGGFYWSRNEYEIAKLKGNHYYLYLVDLSQTSCLNYSPRIIQDPANNIMRSEEWLTEVQSYYIRHI